MKLAALFSDHAVLQREMPIPVWGWSTPHTRVKVTLGEQTAEYFTDDVGKFLVRFPAMGAGGPYDLTALDVKSGAKTTVKDIWIGEVWLAAGQSNMEWTLNACGESGCRAAQCVVPDIRMINVPHHAFAGRQHDFSPALPTEDWCYCCQQKNISGAWFVAGMPETADFSAVAYYFAQDLYEKLQVKIGIVSVAWGGTCIEAWTSRETLLRNPDMTARVVCYEALLFAPESRANYQAAEINTVPLSSSDCYPADPGNTGFARGWATGTFDDRPWPTMMLPTFWQADGENYSGVFWFRKTVELPDSWTGKELWLQLGAVDKQDVTYYNGEPVGATGSGFEESYWNQAREYRIPGTLVKAGRNIIAVRVYSFVYAGGLTGPAEQMKIGLSNNPDSCLSLHGEWRYQCEHNLGTVAPAPTLPGPGNPNSLYMLFDNMIAPLIPYALRGAIWYQGEGNTDNAGQYCRMITDLIRDWRFHWGIGDFSFLQVQLANFMASPKENWPALREAQLQAFRETPNSGLVVTIDIGEPDNIHPRNKWEVGRRLALWALSNTYQQQVVASGPLYRDMIIEENRIRVFFDYVGNGLVARQGMPDGFLIAGNNREFLPAEVVINDDCVVVSHPDIKQPIAVRYAWKDNPEEVSLYNTEGLPASPFRTDTW